MSTVCSQCGRNDEVKKVSAVVKMYESQGEGCYAGGRRTGTLAQLLAAPNEPRLETDYRSPWSMLICLGMIVFISVLSIACITLGVASLQASAAGSTFPRSIGTVATLVVGALLGLVLLTFGVYLRRYSVAHRRIAAQTTRWKAAMQLWSRLYYCFRDDVVFDPETGEACPPETMLQDLLDT